MMAHLTRHAVLPLLILCAVAAATQGPILSFSFDGTTTSDDGGTTLTPQGSGFTYSAGVNSVSQAASFLSTTFLTSTSPLEILPSGNAPRSVALWVNYQEIVGVDVYVNLKITPLVWWGEAGTGLLSGFIFGSAFGFVGSNFIDVWNTSSFSPSVWYHVAYTYDTNTVCTYIDGVKQLCSSTCWTSMLLCNQPMSNLQTTPNTLLTMGPNSVWKLAPFVGKLDNVLIYDRALSSAEVAALAVAPSSSSAPSITPSRTGTPSSTPNPSCLPSAYTSYPYMDLSGTVLSVNLGAPSEKDCQLACCGAAQCTGYSWAGMLPNLACFLLANVTGVTPNLLFSSGICNSIPPTPPPTSSPTPTPTPAPTVTPPYPSAGLLFAFAFDNTTTSVDGDTILTPQGPGMTFVPGVVGGQAVSFPVVDGDSAWLKSSPLASLPSGNSPRTVAMWILPYAYFTPAVSSLAIWGGGQPGGPPAQQNAFYFSPAALTFDSSNRAGYASATVSLHEWQHVAFTFDATSVTIYLNGVAVFGPSAAPSCCECCFSNTNTPANTALIVGGPPSASYYGAIDELLVYSRALSPGEVLALATRPSFTAYPSATASASTIRSVVGSSSSVSSVKASATVSPAVNGGTGLRPSPTGTAQGTPSVSLTSSPAPTFTSTFLPGVITTFAGSGIQGYSGDGGPALLASLYFPAGVAIDSAGNVFFTDWKNNRVRLVKGTTQVISTYAGNGIAGYSGDAGPASSAQLDGPYGVALDASGNLLIADMANSRIRLVVAQTGIIYTYAGNGVGGYSGDGGQATAAQLFNPISIALDTAGNLYISDNSNYRIRLVTKATGIMSTCAGSGGYGYSGDGGPATSAKMYNPTGVAVDAEGNVYFSDTTNQRIRQVSKSTGLISTYAGNGDGGFSGDGGPATLAMLSVNGPSGLAVDAAGNLFIADTPNQRVRFVDRVTGVISTYAGNGVAGYSEGQATSSQICYPIGLAVDAVGTLYIADQNGNRIRTVTGAVLSQTVTPSFTPTPTSTPFCASAMYRPLPRTDLVGTLTGNAWYPGTSLPAPSEAACRQACCDAPLCDAYTFAANDLQLLLSQSSGNPVASCFLYTNVTALVPSSTMSSGALLSTYS